jgi:hypothetical protein
MYVSGFFGNDPVKSGRFTLIALVLGLVAALAYFVKRSSHYYMSESACKSPIDSVCSGGPSPVFCALGDSSAYLDAEAYTLGGFPRLIGIRYARKKDDVSLTEEQIRFPPFTGTINSHRLGELRVSSGFQGDSGKIRIEIPRLGVQTTLTMRRFW